MEQVWREAIETSTDVEIIRDIELKFTENSEVGDGACSCVCISDEQCCACLIQ